MIVTRNSPRLTRQPTGGGQLSCAEPALQRCPLSSPRKDENPESQFAENDGIDGDLRLIRAKPFDYPPIGRWLSRLAQYVEVDQIFHSVPVDSESTGTKKPFGGHERSQLMAASSAGSTLSFRFGSARSFTFTAPALREPRAAGAHCCFAAVAAGPVWASRPCHPARTRTSWADFRSLRHSGPRSPLDVRGRPGMPHIAFRRSHK